MKNALTFDLEPWFVGHILQKGMANGWDREGLRITDTTRKCLDILAEHKTKATFFVLGWVAKRVPGLIVEVEKAGHEIASHGYGHRLLTRITPQEFIRDIDRSLEVLRDCVNQKIKGYRAPSFTLNQQTDWVLDILARKGFCYDSSIFPTNVHPDYGKVSSPLHVYELAGGLIEVPLTCVRMFGQRIPCGGGYFRVYPYRLTRMLLRRCNREGRPVIFYLHPWELDDGQPRIDLGGLNTLRHYWNLGKTATRLHRLLKDFAFTTVSEVLGL